MKLPYFAYGSNLNDRDRRRWCSERGVEDFVAGPGELVYLPDHELVFHYRSVARRGGALDVRPRLGQCTAGLLYPLTEAGLAVLDRKEGVPSCYERKRVVVLDGQGQWREALTYTVIESQRLPAHVQPGPGYQELVAEALIEGQLSTAMLDAAARGEPCPWQVRELFVYGTLMRGEVADWRLENCQYLGAGRARGRLFNLGRYPGTRPALGAEDWVAGELVQMSDPGATLAALDAYEEFLGFGDLDSEYQRVLIEVESGSERRLAWAYQLTHEPVGGLIHGGDWRRR